jgi:hypothetical protein
MINVIMRGPIRPSLDFTLAAIDNVNKSMCGQNWRLTVTTWEAPEGEQLKKRFPDQVLLSCIPIQEESINACPSNKPEHLWWYQHPWALSYLRRLVSTQNVLKIIPPGEWIIETRTDNNIIFNPIDFLVPHTWVAPNVHKSPINDHFCGTEDKDFRAMWENITFTDIGEDCLIPEHKGPAENIIARRLKILGINFKEVPVRSYILKDGHQIA